MKNLKILSALPIVFLVLTGPGCSNKTVEMQATIDELSTQNTELERKVTNLQSHLDESTDNYDHLMARYETLERSTKEPVRKLSAEENELVELVKSLNQSFNNLLVTRDVQTVLNNFYEDFTSNVIMVSLYDVVNVRRGDAVTYPQQLEHILLNNDKIQYIEVKLADIFHIEVRNDDLGIIYFEDDLTILTNESKKVATRVLIQIVAKKYDGEWKIGNYTSVNMAQYEENV